MPTRKVLILVLVLYIVLVFIPVLGFLYFKKLLPFKFLNGESAQTVKESSESSVTPSEDQFGKLVSGSIPSKEQFFALSNFRNGKFEGINESKKTIEISIPIDDKGTLEKNTFTFTDNLLVLCNINKVKDSLGNEIEASSVFVDMNKMSDLSYSTLFKYFKDIPLEERLNELKNYKVGNAIHYETADKSKVLYWVKIFKGDCGKFSASIYDQSD